MDFLLTENGTIWPRCKKSGCKAYACRRLDSEFCFPHSNTPKDKIFKMMVYTEPKQKVKTK